MLGRRFGGGGGAGAGESFAGATLRPFDDFTWTRSKSSILSSEDDKIVSTLG